MPPARGSGLDLMFGIYATNPDESLCAAIAWTMWSEGRLATDLLAGALPGIEHQVYWTPPCYYLVLSLWQGLWGPGLLAVRSLSMLLGAGLLLVLWRGRRHLEPGAWTASALVLFDPLLQRVSSMARMDMLAILLTAAALTLLEDGRRRRHDTWAGLLAAGAMLTHPLGTAAAVAGGITCLLGGRRRWLPFLAGCAPPLLVWLLYIGVDSTIFLAQMRLQLAVKAGRAASPLKNLEHLVLHYDRFAALALAAFAGGLAGLVLDRRRRRPWLIALACLVPVVLLSGELVYPAYLVPFSAVGGCALLSGLPRARRVLAGVVGVVLVALAADPPPLAGVDPNYASFAESVSQRVGQDHTLLLAVVPDPWFALRETRPDLRLRLAPPVALPEATLRAYVAQADDIVLGGYNPRGLIEMVKDWDGWRRPGQKLWLTNKGRIYDFDRIRTRLKFRDPW